MIGLLIYLIYYIYFFRSPSDYNFLRDNKILSLLFVNSIRNHLIRIRIGGGLDLNLCPLIKKFFYLNQIFKKKVCYFSMKLV